MFCSKCGNQNNEGANFCRFCGGKLNIGPESNFGKNESPKKSKSWKNIFHLWSGVGLVFTKIKNKFSYKIAIILIIIILISGGVAFAAPKAKDYFNVNKAIGKARELQNSGNYEAALASVIGISDKWSLASQKEEMTRLQEKQNNYIEYKKLFNDATEKESGGAFNEAREILKPITSDFPEYNLVEDKLSELQTKIEEQLKADVEEADKRTQAETAAKKRAQAQAAAEAEAKRQAEAQSQVDAAARAQAQAQSQADAAARARAQAEADASARAAQEAETRRQQEALQKAEEVRKSFVNQLITGYGSYTQAGSYYSSAITYSNSGNSLLAISQATSARAVLNSARNGVYDLNSRFTGLPSNYYAAASNMVSAIDYLIEALDLMVQSEGTYLDYSSSVNNYKNLSSEYANRVKLFLDSQ